MPEVDGIQLLEYVKSEDALRSVPVIMMSSIEKGDTVYQCVQGGAEEYLVKPVTRKEVQHMWQHVLRKRSVAATVPQAPLAAAHAAAQEADAGPFLAIAPAAAEDERHEGSSAEALPSPVNQSAAQPKSALRSPAPPKSPQVPSKEDLGATCQFLQLMRSTHMEEMAALKQQVAALEADAALVAAGLRASMESQGSGCLSTPSGEEPASKRQRCGVATDPRTCSQHTPQVGAHPIAGRLKELESVYFGRRHAGGERHYLEGFARDLNVLARGKTLTQVATLRAGDIASPQEMVSWLPF